MQNMHNSFTTSYFKYNKIECACRWLTLLKLERERPHTARFQLTAVPIVNYQLKNLVFKFCVHLDLVKEIRTKSISIRYCG